MKLLILCSRFPYPIEKGDKLRIFYQIRELASRHELVLIALTDQHISQEDFKAVEKFCSNIYLFRLRKFRIAFRLLRALLGSVPWQVAFFFRKDFAQKIQRIAQKENPDMVFCQLLRMAEYARKLPFPKTLDYMDAFSLGMARRARKSRPILNRLFSREARLLSKYEKEIYSDFDHHCIISEADREQLGLAPSQKVEVVPNGVDTRFFSPLPGISQKYELVFVGNMGYFPNAEAAKYLVKEVLPLLPDTLRLQLAGARPTAEVRALAGKQVTVTGWVDDIRKAYASGSIFVAPLFTGSGQQNKILEAMSMGLPCITTSLVNRAIGAVPGQEILIADEPEAFADKIRELLGEPARADQIAVAGQKLVREKYSWRHAVNLLEGMWKEG